MRGSVGAGRPRQGGTTVEERIPNDDDAGIEDLDADAEEAENVTGGRMADPCEGGE
jgi:hypothetical protein